MIRFSDGQNRIEMPKGNVGGFRDIKPSSDITKSGARDFWDNIFSGPEETTELDIEDIVKEIYGRDENDFSFDIAINSEIVREALGYFKKEVWNELSYEDKEKAINNFGEVVAGLLGISQLPIIKFYESHIYDCGCFVPDDNTLWINKNNISDSQEIVNTVAHEMRHAFQYERAKKLETYDDYLYAINFANYIVPQETEDGYVNFLDYQDQLIEAEARSFAGLFVIEEVGNE